MLGIDVSKATLACALVDPASKQVLWQEEHPNAPYGVLSVLERTPKDSPWVLEPTGRYSQLAARLGFEAGRQVLMAPPRRAKAFMASIQTRAVTDPIASVGLALFALSQQLPAYPLKSEKVEALDQLLRARRGIGRAITSLEQQRRELPSAASYLTDSLAALRAQQKALDQQITRASRQAETAVDADRLKKVPGIGPVTSAASASCLRNRAFSDSDQFVAYIGLDVGVVQSGKRQGERGLTKQGDAELRRLFFNCARCAVQAKNSPFRGQFERERAKGLSKTACYCAVARKLARLCWSLVKHQSEYQAERVHRQPKKEEEDPS